MVVESRNIANNLGDGNIYIVEGIKSDGIKLKGLFPYYHSSLFESVEILKENNMKKFKVGDKVVRVSETYVEAVKGGVYEVSEVSHNEWVGSYGINLKGHKVEGMGKLNYESSCFDLYIDDVLSPLEAAEALMNKDKLQVFDSDANKWYGFHNELRNITLEDLKHIKLRRKPKTVIINGMEVVAPVELPRYTEGYTPSLCHREVQTASAGKGRIMWTTKEDAQKALDAMLIPFKGD